MATKITLKRYSGSSWEDLYPVTSYDNITDKPTIPAAANNGTLTLKVNGVQKQTFTANQSTNVTFDVTAESLGLSKALTFKGVSNTVLSDGATTTTIEIGATTYTVSSTVGVGWVVLYEDYEYMWTGSAWEKLGGDSSFALANHTHSYAGSSSAGGAATSANKLNTNAGSATQPVYFSGGVPVACTYSLNKTVPADAVFTDTNTWRGIQNNLTSTSTTDSLSAYQGYLLANGSARDSTKLPLSGGTINSSALFPLTINSTYVNATQGPVLYFQHDGTRKASTGYYNNLAYIGNETSPYAKIALKMDGTPVYSPDNGTTLYTLVHSGNISSYAITSHQDISGKANLASPTFTGTVTIPTLKISGLTHANTTAFAKISEDGTITKDTNTYSTTSHTHTTSIATSSGTNQLTLAFGTKYALTTGGTSYIFTMPSNPNTNTWRPIAVGGTNKLTDSSTTLNFAGSGATSVSYSNGTITISSTDNDTTYESKTAAANGTAVSLVTTGEKYIWNAKSNFSGSYTDLTDVPTTFTPTSHTHTTSIATSTGTNQITLAYGGKYAITAGGTSYVFTMPSADDTNTWRKVQLNGTDKLGTGTSTNPLNIKAGSNMTITESSGTFTFAATDTTYSSKSAASGGTDVSLVTTGEKYTWNNKSNLAIGTTASTAAAGNHTHGIALAADSGTNAITLAHGTKYKLTAGGSSIIFTMPSDNNTTYTAGTGLTLSSGQFSVSQANASTILNLLSEESSDPVDNDYYISQYVGGGTSTTTYHRRPVSKLYNYMKGKFDSVYSASGHTHSQYLTSHQAVSSSNNTASWGNAVVVGTVGGTELKFTMPANPDTDSNTWRPIAVNGTTQINDRSTTLNLKAGSNVSLSYSSGTVTINSSYTDTNTHYTNSLTIKGAGTAVTTFAQSADKTLDIVAGSNVTVTPDATNGKITISSTDTNTWRPVGTGASDAAAGNHTHTASLATDTGTSAITLAYGGKYKLTAGGQSVIFTMPASDNTNTWRPLGTTADTACAGNDSRLSDSRPASDVYSWAKASTKPSYTYSEVGAAASSHTHEYAASASAGGPAKYVAVRTTPPTSANSNGVTLVILNSSTYSVSGTTKYAGYVYMWY